MNQPKQPEGNFKMNLNFRRNGNPKAPPITGSISTPEAPETMFVNQRATLPPFTNAMLTPLFRVRLAGQDRSTGAIA